MAKRQINEQVIDELLKFIDDEQNKNEQKKRLITLLKRLDKLFQQEYEDNQYSNYQVYQGFDDLAKFKNFRTKNKLENSMKLALDYETEILDILRGQKLKIIIQRSNITDKGQVVSTNQYVGNEADVTLGLIKDGDVVTGVSYLIKETKDLIKTSANEKKNESFLKHYNTYYNMASDLLNHKGRFKDTGINEGNIVEAFYRHLNYVHGKMEIDATENYDDKDIQGYKEVAIELYYSIGFDPWWTGGDIGLVQIKANNQQLASLLSIRAVAAKLLNIFMSDSHITRKDFDKIFNRQQQEEISSISDEDARQMLEQVGVLRNMEVDMNLF